MAQDLTRAAVTAAAHPDDAGTGIYWFRDDAGRYEQAFVPDLTLARARTLAANLATADGRELDAYRWVPNQVASAQSLIAAECGGRCSSDNNCVDAACRCLEGRCRRT